MFTLPKLARTCQLTIAIVAVAVAAACEAYPQPAATDTQQNAGWSATQLANANTIVTVGQQMGVSHRARVVALAAAMQESSLRNLPDGPDDSAGLFQQRPSQGWGSWAEVTSPTYAARKFYDTLLSVRGWQSLPVGVAAQKVQRSAYPDAYTKWIDDAERLAGNIT